MLACHWFFQWFSSRFHSGWVPSWSWGGSLSVIKHERQIIQCCMRTYGPVRPGGLPGGPLSVIKHGDRIARQAMLATMKMQREEADKAKAIEDAEHGDEWAQLLNMQ